MRLSILLVTLLPLSVMASELGYDEIFVHYATSEFRDGSTETEDRIDAFQAAIVRQVAEDWFVVGSLMYSNYDWVSEYRVRDDFGSIGIPGYRDIVADVDRKQLYTSLGIGRRWGLGATTDLTLTGLLTYYDAEDSKNYVADHYDWTGTYLRTSTGSSSGSFSDQSYRVELGLRSMLTERVEGFGMIARSADFDATSYHLGARYALTNSFDATVRHVITVDVKGWWAGVVYRY